MLSELRPKGSVQASLFPSAGDPWKSERLMAAMDAANRKWGRGTLKVASAGTENHWSMRRDRKSPGYTTDWDGLPAVKAK
jgi:DNA polymerase V